MYLPRTQAALLLTAVSASTAMPAGARETLEEIVVTATRVEKPLGQVPLAVSVIGKEDIQLGRQELGLDESLARVPGVFMQNRYNFTQDLRVSIRGFGSRASFGIRGIKVIADGIPVTLADGQSGTDDLDIGSASRIEVVRGPAASLYGTASGGVISVHTEDGPEDPFVEAKLTAGAYDHQKYQFKTGGQYGDLNYLINASHLTMDGYRDHSSVQHSLVNSKFRYDIDETSDVTLIANAVNSPWADDPGGLTREDVAADRRQAQSRNISSDSGEKFNQQRVGLVYDKAFNESHEITLRGYHLWKDFLTFLPIGSHIPFVSDDGVVQFDRKFYGGGGRYTWTGEVMGRSNRLTAGFDIDMQRDDRQRFINNAGVQGALVFDQLEKAESYGFYFRNEFDITETVELSVGGRYDEIDLSVDDRYFVNGDQSGALNFSEFSPSVGLVWSFTPTMSIYTSYASSFETPTFTELGTPAQELNVNLGGFNNVKPQQARSFEIGIKGETLERIRYEVAAFTMEVDDEIVNIESIENRAFFENADSDRKGIEAGLQARIMDGLNLTASYTLSDFTFDRFPASPEAVGKWVPGIPRHQFYGELAYRHESGAYLIWDARYVGKLFADNENTFEMKVEPYWVSNVRFGGEFRYSDVTVSPFFGITNVFDEKYFSNVRINAFGGRAFEPAPVRHVYGGLNIRYNFL